MADDLYNVTPPVLTSGEMLRLATRLDRNLSRGLMSCCCEPTEFEWRGIIDALRIAANAAKG